MNNNLKSIINKNRHEIAFLIGNGINLYNNKDNKMSWNNILLDLWKKYVDKKIDEFPKSGITYPEIFDIIEINNYDKSKLFYELQKMICKEMKLWKYHNHHKRIIEYIKKLNCPVLTTNFDDLLSSSNNLDFYKLTNEKFTDFYPWSCYYRSRILRLPTDGFAIWNIQGMVKYPRSIRLGLTHYAGSIEKARTLLHKGDDSRLFSGKNRDKWRGYQTWLHIVFNKSLFIFGLNLEENEAFIRWLLIERAKYFKLFPDRKKKGWFVRSKIYDEKSKGKDLFLKHIGFEVIEIKNRKELYDIFND